MAKPFEVLLDGPAKRRAETENRMANGRPVALPPAYTPFPVNDLPEPLKSLVIQGAGAIGPSCDPAFVALPALAVAASLIGATRTIALKRTWKEPSVLWSVIVGDSGTLKSPAMMLAINPFFELQGRLRGEHKDLLRQYEKEKEDRASTKSNGANDLGPAPEKPLERRVICSDITIEAIAEILDDSPQGCLLWQDELDSWFQSFKRYKSGKGGSDRPQWLSIHSARAIVYDRKTGDKRTIIVPWAAVSVTGGIQPGVLAQDLDPGAMESGLGARLLLAYPPHVKKQWTDAELPAEVDDAYAELLLQLSKLSFHTDLQGRPRPHVLQLSSEAKGLWVDYYNTWAEEQFAAEGQLRAAFSKIEAYAARFALIIHTVAGLNQGISRPTDVSADAVYAGINLANWFANEARRVYQVLSESEDARHTRCLIEWIRQRGGKVSVRDLHRSNPSKYQTAEDARADLDDLVERKVLKKVPVPPPEHGGRPPADLFVLTELTIDKTDKTPRPPSDGDG